MTQKELVDAITRKLHEQAAKDDRQLQGEVAWWTWGRTTSAF